MATIPLTTLDGSLQALKEQFNRDADRARFLTLLSPT